LSEQLAPSGKACLFNEIAAGPVGSPNAFRHRLRTSSNKSERITHTVLVPTMINLLTQFAEVKKFDLGSIEFLAYGGSPMAPELIREARLTAEELIAHCRQTLASYKVPRRVEFSQAELPKSGSGKVLKRALGERFWAHADSEPWAETFCEFEIDGLESTDVHRPAFGRNEAYRAGKT